MKKVGKHAWGTPKCGISLLTNVWSGVHVDDSDYSFVLARNPYDRIVSLFAEKVVDVNGNLRRKNNIEEITENNIERVEQLCSHQLCKYWTGIEGLRVRDVTFRKFCFHLDPKAIDSGDPHVKKQCWEKPNHEFDDVLWVHDLPECFEIPVKKLDLKNFDISKETLIKKGGAPKGPNHFTPRSDDLNSLKDPWDITIKEWWDLAAFPSDYNVLYNDEMRETVYNLYKEDFDYFGLKK